MPTERNVCVPAAAMLWRRMAPGVRVNRRTDDTAGLAVVTLLPSIIKADPLSARAEGPARPYGALSVLPCRMRRPPSNEDRGSAFQAGRRSRVAPVIVTLLITMFRNVGVRLPTGSAADAVSPPITS